MLKKRVLRVFKYVLNSYLIIRIKSLRLRPIQDSLNTHYSIFKYVYNTYYIRLFAGWEYGKASSSLGPPL